MEKIIYEGYRIKIRQDDSAESPDEWINEDVFLVYDHRDFYVKRDNFNPSDIIKWLNIKRILDCPVSGDEDQEELKEELEEYFDYSAYYIYPVYAYIHSGVSLSLGKSSYPFTCPWDTSMRGFVLVDKTDETTEEKAYELAEGLINTWNQYLSGEVYGFIVEKPKPIYSIEKWVFDRCVREGLSISDLEKEFMIEDDWEEIDSCWGYYGYEECLENAKESVDYTIKYESK